MSNKRASLRQSIKFSPRASPRDLTKINEGPLSSTSNTNKLVDTDPLIKAAKKGDSEALTALLKAMPSNKDRLNYINARDRNGSTALFHAVWPGRLDAIATLLYYGADPNIQNNRLNTALHLACEKNHKDIIKLLIENGANAEILNCNDSKCYEKPKDESDINNVDQDQDTNENNESKHFIDEDLFKFITKCSIEHEEDVINHLSTNLTPEERSQYKAMFDAIDYDNDGFIQFEEIIPFLQTLPRNPPTVPEMKVFFYDWWDMDGDKKISFNDFLVGALFQIRDHDSKKKKKKRGKSKGKKKKMK